MRTYLITIVMHDGSGSQYQHQSATDWEAIDDMFDAFHDARVITARRLP